MISAAAAAGTVAATVIVAVLGLWLDRRDKRKALENEIKTIPDNPDGVRLARERVRRIKAAAAVHVQPERRL